LLSSIAHLPGCLPEQREALLLVGLEGMDYESVAPILGVPIGTVRSLAPVAGSGKTPRIGEG